MGNRKGAYGDLARLPEGKRPLGNLGVDGRIILKWIFNNGGMDCISLVQDRDRWWASVNAVKNLRVP